MGKEMLTFKLISGKDHTSKKGHIVLGMIRVFLTYLVIVNNFSCCHKLDIDVMSNLGCLKYLVASFPATKIGGHIIPRTVAFSKDSSFLHAQQLKIECRLQERIPPAAFCFFRVLLILSSEI